MIVIIEDKELEYAVCDYVAMQQDKQVSELSAVLIIKDNEAYFEVSDKEH